MASMISLPMPQLRQEPINLLNLPLEVQLRIYEYALSDPNLWDRRHRGGCDLCPLTQQVMNQPPFMSHRVVVDAVPKRGPRIKVPWRTMGMVPTTFSLAKTWTACDCGKRRGTHLLRTNRHIFSVAAHMLWSRGSLCFFDAAEFAACVEATSPGTRALIRGVSIMSLFKAEAVDPRVCLRSQGYNGQDCPSDFSWNARCLPEFWRLLQLLPRLQHLAVPQTCLEDYCFFGMTDDQFLKTKAYLARLGYIVLTYLTVILGNGDFRQVYYGNIHFWAEFLSGKTLASLCGFSERIETTTWLYDITNLHSQDDTFHHRLNWAHIEDLEDFWYHSQEFAHRTCRATQMQTMEQDSTTIAGTQWWRPQARVIAGGGTATVCHDSVDALEVAVTFYNAPLSRDACVNSNLTLARRCAELERLGRTFEAGQRKRKLAWEEKIRRFEALSLEERHLYVFEHPEGKLRVPKPIVEKPPPTKRVRTKKNRRGYQKRGAGQE